MRAKGLSKSLAGIDVSVASENLLANYLSWLGVVNLAKSHTQTRIYGSKEQRYFRYIVLRCCFPEFRVLACTRGIDDTIFIVRRLRKV